MSAVKSKIVQKKRLHTVSIAEWDGENQKGFVEITKEVLLPVIQRDVILSVPHSHTRPPVADKQFHIFIWSSPSGRNNGEVPQSMWGFQVCCRDKGFLSSGQGIPIVDSASGWDVAEIVGNNLYIHHDLCHRGVESELQIYRRLLQEVVVELLVSPEEKVARQKKLAAEERERSKVAWIRAHLRFVERTLENTRESIKHAERATEAAQAELVKQIRICEGQKRKLTQIEATRPEVETKCIQEFDRLIKLPHIVRVTMDDDKIQVFTDRMFAEHANKRYDIGDFKIEIYMNGRDGGVFMFNLTRQVDGFERGMQAPHVFRSGKPCLGNLKEAIPQYIGEGEYSIVVMLCVQYLQSVNVEDSAGRHINNWPHEVIGV